MMPSLRLLTGSVVLATAAFTLNGCAKLSYTRAATTTDTVHHAAGEIDVAKRQVEQANAVIQSISAAAPGSDIRPSLERYRESIAALDQSLALLKQRGHDMTENGDRYFAAWRTALADQQGSGSRRPSEARERELKEHFGQIRARYMIARHEFDPLMVKLYDSRALLTVDPQSAVATAKDYAPKVDADAKMALQALDTLAESLRSLGAEGSLAAQ